MLVIVSCEGCTVDDAYRKVIARMKAEYYFIYLEQIQIT